MLRYTIFILTSFVLITSGLLSCKKGKLDSNNITKLQSGTTERLNDIVFIGNKAIVVGGDRFHKATILTSVDGGNTWNLQDHPEAGKGMYGVTATASGKLVSVGYDGKMLTSEDSGSTWSFNQIDKWREYKGIYLKNDGTAIVIGGVSFNSGFIVQLDKDGRNTSFDSMAIELNDIVMVDDLIGYISGYGVVLKTTNGGNNWNFLDIKNDNFKALHVIGNEIWTCGYGGSIFHSTDGGITWDKQRNGNNVAKASLNLVDIYFTDSNNGWAAGENGLLIQTTDGGNTWKKYKDFTENALRSITQGPDGYLYIAGDGGALYKVDI